MTTTPTRPIVRAVDVDRLYAAHTAATSYFQTQLQRHDGPPAYLRGRGLDAALDRESPWRIGYAPRAWTALGDHLRAAGFTDAELLRGGLAFRNPEGRVLDLFRDRIVFPIRDGHGRTIGFTGRIWQPPSPGQTPPKYLNSPETPIYTKGEVLFGLAEQHDRIARGWPPVIVEGPIDALAIWITYPATGRTGLVAVATCGTALTAHQVDTVVELPGARRFGVAVGFDGDDAGRKAVDRAYTLLTERHPATVARAAQFTAGADPGDLAPTADGRAQLRGTLERGAEPLLHVVIDHRVEAILEQRPRFLHEVEGRVLLARSLAPLIADRNPAEVVAAVGHVGDLAVSHAAGTPDGVRAAADTVHCLTSAVIDYLETTPRATAGSAPGPGPPASAHPSATAFPTRPLANGIAAAPWTAGHASGRQSTTTARHRR